MSRNVPCKTSVVEAAVLLRPSEPRRRLQRRKRTVLFIVDDEPTVLRALQWIFEQQGYQVYAFESAPAARRALRRRRPQLVISDNYMPKVEGLAFLMEVRKTYQQIRTVLLTGGFIDDRIKSAVSAGEIDALIQKPWNLNDLIEQVRKLLESPTST